MEKEQQDNRLPTCYIPHGGGPCFFMDWTMGPADTWDNMKQWLSQLGNTISPAPKAIIVISAHWESDVVAINNGNQPPLLYDYFGFPKHTYELQYSAPGSPALAERIEMLFSAAGIASTMDSERGFDHGVFIPLLLAYPSATIPIVQVSLDASLDPARHIQIGRALAPLRSEEVLIIGSGLSYHNGYKMAGQDERISDSDQFDQWLTRTCTSPASERDDLLCHWSDAPAARDAHPREEHLMPLMVIAGAAGDDHGKRVFSDRVMGATVSAYQFG